MRPLATLLAVLAAACGGGSEELPVCSTAGSIAFEGELDGEPIDVRLAMSSMSIEDLSGPTHNLELVVSSDGLDRLEIEFGDDYDEDIDGYAARGFIMLAQQDGLVAGNCNIDSFVSTLRFDDDEMTSGTFTLRGLHEQPFCDGALFTGVISGCFRAP